MFNNLNVLFLLRTSFMRLCMKFIETYFFMKFIYNYHIFMTDTDDDDTHTDTDDIDTSSSSEYTLYAQQTELYCLVSLELEEKLLFLGYA